MRLMRLRYTALASRDIENIHKFIAEHNPNAATRVAGAIRAAAERLRFLPLIGRPGMVADTREWVVTGLPYIIIYRVDNSNDTIIILRVYHGAQSRTP